MRGVERSAVANRLVADDIDARTILFELLGQRLLELVATDEHLLETIRSLVCPDGFNYTESAERNETYAYRTRQPQGVGNQSSSHES